MIAGKNFESGVAEQHPDINENHNLFEGIRSHARRLAAIAGIGLAACGTPFTTEAYADNTKPNINNVLYPNVVGQKALGDKKLATILLQYPDSPLEITRQNVENILYNDPDSVSAIFKKESYGNFSFSNNTSDRAIFGPYTVTNYVKDTYCEAKDWTKSINDSFREALKDNPAIISYDRFLFIQPPQNSCIFFGISAGKVALASTAPELVKETAIHELGHTIGFGHSNSLDCAKPKDISWDNCTNSEYGNDYDFMGNTLSSELSISHIHFSGFDKAVAGWTKPIAVKANGKPYYLAPIDKVSTKPHAATIQLNESGQYLFFDYRYFGKNKNIRNGLAIMKAGKTDNLSVDAFPDKWLINADSNGDSDSQLLLREGSSYKIKNEGIVIKTFKATKKGITFSVSKVKKKNTRR